MNAEMAPSRQTRSIAALAALAASLFTMVGTLTLADHYAHTGSDGRHYAAANPAARYAAPTLGRHAAYGQAAKQS
jgi:hypothetical protein